MLLALTWVVRGLLAGLPGAARTVAPPATSRSHSFGRTVASVLSVAVIYKFFFDSYAQDGIDPRPLAAGALATLVGIVLVPPVETLVAVAALTVFLMQNTAAFGQVPVAGFALAIVVFVVLRWLLGR